MRRCLLVALLARVSRVACGSWEGSYHIGGAGTAKQRTETLAGGDRQRGGTLRKIKDVFSLTPGEVEAEWVEGDGADARE